MKNRQNNPRPQDQSFAARPLRVLRTAGQPRWQGDSVTYSVPPQCGSHPGGEPRTGLLAGADPETALRVALYIRVSTDRQVKEGDSLEEQENELKKFCEYRRFQMARIYIERGKSGGNTNRPEYQKLICDIESEKINAVVVKKLDRLSRSLLDFEELMTQMQQHAVEFISIKENFDTTTAMGKAMLRVALVFAQLEREQTSERLKDVLAFRAEQGMYNGGIRPFGYTSVNKELLPYPKEKVMLEQIFAKFLETRSTTETAKFLNQAGFRNRNDKLWDKRTLQQILRNPTYMGKVRWGHKLFPGLHAPLVSEKTFHEVQHIFREKLLQNREGVFLLQKLLFCGSCQRVMTPSHSLNRTKKKFLYYRCMSTQSSEKGKSRCAFKQANAPVLEERLQKSLLSLSESQFFASIENKSLKHNQAIDSALSLLQKEHEIIALNLKEVSSKKEAYFDSLVLGGFSGAERDKISKRIAEMEAEEKQFKAKSMTCEFEMRAKEDEKIRLDQLKRMLLDYKIKQADFSPTEHRNFLCVNLHRVEYHPEKLAIHFKLLPWPIEVNP